MSEAKKINEYLLDEELLKKINNKADALNTRLKSDLIKMDDLSEELRNKIQGWAAPAGSSYDDTELRERIKFLEQTYIPRSEAYDKTRDIITPDFLNKDLSDSMNQINQNKLDIAELKHDSADKSQVRYNDTPIEINDLSEDVRKKINSAYSYYQSIIPGGNADVIDDVPTLIATMNEIKKNAITGDMLNQYRKKDIKIGSADLETGIVNDINKINSIEEAVNDKIDRTSVVSTYRKNTDKINENDLTADLLNKITSSYGFVVNVDAKIVEEVNANMNTVIDIIKNELVGSISGMDNPYFPITIQRQIASHANKDPYLLMDILRWFYYEGIGDKYNKLSSDDQRAICQYNGISPNGNRGYGDEDVTYAAFSIVDAINYILHKKISSLENSISSINSDIQSIKSDISTLNKNISTLQTDVAALKLKVK